MTKAEALKCTQQTYVDITFKSNSDYQIPVCFLQREFSLISNLDERIHFNLTVGIINSTYANYDYLNQDLGALGLMPTLLNSTNLTTDEYDFEMSKQFLYAFS